MSFSSYCRPYGPKESHCPAGPIFSRNAARHAQAMPKEPRELELDQDPLFQRANWRFERIGWAAMAILLLAAGLGLFGKGPLSHATVSTANAHLSYQRFSHWESPERLAFSVQTQADQTILRLSRTYLERVWVEDITPAPIATRALPEWIEFRFQTGRGHAAIAFHIQPQAFGLQRARFVVDDGAPATFWQFVYP